MPPLCASSVPLLCSAGVAGPTKYLVLVTIEILSAALAAVGKHQLLGPEALGERVWRAHWCIVHDDGMQAMRMCRECVAVVLRVWRGAVAQTVGTCMGCVKRCFCKRKQQQVVKRTRNIPVAEPRRRSNGSGEVVPFTCIANVKGSRAGFAKHSTRPRSRDDASATRSPTACITLYVADAACMVCTCCAASALPPRSTACSG